MSAIFTSTFIVVAVLLSSFPGSKSAPRGCFESIISFGDSLADTGNDRHLNNTRPPRWGPALPPYGRTYFHRVTGRCSDGRVVLDFIAQSLGLPLVPPYLGGEKGNISFRDGVNFAVAGAATLSTEFYAKMGNPTDPRGPNISLEFQWGWFKQVLATIPDNRRFLQKSLILMGEFGGNDYMFGANTTEARYSLVPPIVNNIGLKIQDLIELGAKTILAPGIPPLGCLPSILTKCKNTSTTNDYDQQTGCLKWWNNLTMHHNELLQKELNRLQNLHPNTVLIYADFYNSVNRIFISPQKFGFTKARVLRACCGTGGPYNYDDNATCGTSWVPSCADPSSFVSWDGSHFTEAVYKVVADGFMEGNYTIPQMRTICPPINSSSVLQKGVFLFTIIFVIVTMMLLDVCVV